MKGMVATSPAVASPSSPAVHGSAHGGALASPPVAREGAWPWLPPPPPLTPVAGANPTLSGGVNGGAAPPHPPRRRQCVLAGGAHG
ncbi:Os11g0647450 [Oryza sativa Japonica Group]|uniref:Os11g0647450 protein n=1 Tax=Oryza sativa subsp. japonica TaxID=39947 RepID=A0A0P0Y4T8_ORYSJ|nr:Os11g0647450 [Oryza sativa Japonica Group]